MRIVLLLFASLAGGCCTQQRMPSADDKAGLPIEKFYWAGAVINGQHFDKAAMFVPVNINGLHQGAFAQFDLGASHSLLYQKNLAGIRAFRKLVLDTLPDGKTDDGKTLFVIRGAALSLGKIPLGTRDILGFFDYGAQIRPSKKQPVDKKSIGTIGSDVVQQKVLVIDFPKETLCIADSLPPAFATGFGLTDCRLVNNRIVIPVDINGQTRHFLYDTGASLFPMVTTSTIWQAMAGEAVTDTLNIANFGNAVTLCGAMSALPVQIAGRPFGQFTVYHERDDYFDTVFKQIGCDGIIGNAFFLDKKICIDYHNQRFGIGH